MRRVATAALGGFFAASCLLAVRIDEVRIPMKDGVRLAADVWRPEDGNGPWPVLLEYLPYRKTEARGGSSSALSLKVFAPVPRAFTKCTTRSAMTR